MKIKRILNHPRSLLRIAFAASSLFLITAAQAASFTAGNIVVTRYGDGSAGALSAAATNLYVLEYLPSTASQASPVQTISIPRTGTTRLTVAGSSTSEGFITRSTNRSIVTFAGYDADAGTVSISSSNAATVNRVIGTLDSDANYSRVAGGSTTMYSANNIRSAVSDGLNFWTGGGTGGTWYSSLGGTPVQVGGTSNMRVVRMFNGILYYSTGSGTKGIYAFPGAPTAGPTTTNLIIADGNSPYDFAISPDGTVAYVADDTSAATAIQKWTFDGTSWSQKFTFSTGNGISSGCRGLAVDFSGPNPVIYATDAATPSHLITITDTSAFADTSDTTDQATTLATAPANTAFRGVALAPVTVTATPIITQQPADTNIVNGNTLVLSVKVFATAPTFRWYYTNSNTQLSDGASGFGGIISGSSTSNLSLTLIDPAQAGGYLVTISNSAGMVTSRIAQVSVTTAIPPIITNQPVNLTVNAGDPISFSTLVGGSTPLTYVWKVDNGVTTNLVVGSGFTGTNSAVLTNTVALTNFNGLRYFCVITNAYGTNTTTKALLTVNTAPSISIAQFRSLVNGTYAPTNFTSCYTLTGIVTTTTNMTSSTTSSEFFMQDNTGGIAVFWSGAAPSTNLPPQGAQVRITAPAAAFNGLLEIEPVVGNPAHSVTILSSNNPIPIPQPLPMDPNVSFAQLKNEMEGLYVAVSNVTLASGTTFGSSVAEYFTNNNTHSGLTAGNPSFTFTNHPGDIFTLFISSFSGIQGQPKPSGPITMYGVLTFSSLNTLSQGFEFVPLDYAHIVSFVHQTNYLSNLTRLGDAPTNTYTESVLRPGETLTTLVSIGDPDGGSVTLNPSTDGLPASASWSGVTSGTTATATFRFTPAVGDSGTNYVIGIGATSTSGFTSTNIWYVYVPTVQEQSVMISEFLANPTASSSSPYFNPLHRDFDTNNVGTNDQYVEIVNLSGTDLDLYGWSITDTATRRHTFIVGAPNEQLATVSSNTAVIYGGVKTSDPNPPHIPVPSFAANVGGSPSLALPTTGTGVIVLRNSKYYNDNLGIQPGYIVDRVVYNASDLATNGSLTRFPMPNGKLAFVPQAYVSTNATTAGLQYDGASWLAGIQTPQTVSNITVTAGNPLTLSFTATPGLMTTLWKADNLLDSYKASGGQKFGTTSGVFTVTNLPAASQFYYLTTQTNRN